MGSWIGGDRDGNPFVTAEVTRQTLAMQSERALRFYLEELHQLGGELSLDGRIVRRLGRLAGAGRAFARPRRRAPGRALSARHRRHVCASRRHRLGARQAGSAASAGRSGAGLRLGGRLQGRSRHHLRLAVGERRRRPWRAAVCARCAARSTSSASISPSLDLRQNSDVHERVMAELVEAAGGSATMRALDEPGRVALLIARARQHAAALPRRISATARRRRTSSPCCAVAADAHRRYGPRSHAATT